MYSKKKADGSKKNLTKMKKDRVVEVLNRRFLQPPTLPISSKHADIKMRQKHCSMETLNHLLGSRSSRFQRVPTYDRQSSKSPKFSFSEERLKSWSKAISLTPNKDEQKPRARIKFSKQMTAISAEMSYDRNLNQGPFSTPYSSYLGLRSDSPSPNKSKFSPSKNQQRVIEGESAYSALFSAEYFDDPIDRSELALISEIEAMKLLIGKERSDLEFLRELVVPLELGSEDTYPTVSLAILSNLEQLLATKRAMDEIGSNLQRKSRLLALQNELIKLLTTENQEYDLIVQKQLEIMLKQSRCRLATLNAKWSDPSKPCFTSIRRPTSTFRPLASLGNEALPQPARSIHFTVESPNSARIQELRKSNGLTVNKLDGAEKREKERKLVTAEENKSSDLNQSESNSQLCSIRLNTQMPNSFQKNADRRFEVTKKTSGTRSGSR